MLKIEDLSVYYGLIKAVKQINFQVKDGQIVSLIGSNGAGKTSTLASIVSDVKKSGQVFYDGYDISGHPTHRVIKDGIALVPEGRRVFINLTVDENLRMGAYNNDDRWEELRDH
ncbi:MAG: ATP-binding cassette domain-containing protein, partial [Campylobacterota bacterium]|nr:ATP-binding cassette domain-containing protein [Campylobacterota bacterium]